MKKTQKTAARKPRKQPASPLTDPHLTALLLYISGGRDLSDVPVRAFTGFLTLVDAINRAGSTDPEKIRIALTETDIPPEKLIVPWRGIKFGSNGHNMLVRGILMQVQNGKYCTIYPFDLASCEVVYPMPTWEEKAAMK